MSSITRSSLISITLGLLTVIGAIFRLLRLSRRQDIAHVGMARPGPYVSWRWRLGPARFGSYFGGASVSTARAACPLSASAAVTAVTGYSSNSPLFFGRPICASRSRLGLSWSCRSAPVVPWQVLTRRVAVAGRGANRGCAPMPTRRPYRRPHPDRRPPPQLLSGGRYGYTQAILRAHRRSTDCRCARADHRRRPASARQDVQVTPRVPADKQATPLPLWLARDYVCYPICYPRSL